LSEKISLSSIYGVMVYSVRPLGGQGSAGEQPERRGGWMTEGQSLMGSAFLFPAPPDSPKALNSGGSGAEPPRDTPAALDSPNCCGAAVHCSGSAKLRSFL
jgi:hypothetical protein